MLKIESARARWIGGGAIAGGILCISLLHDLIPQGLVFWRDFFQNLYILPIVIAALYWGWRGGLSAAAFSAICDALDFLVASIGKHPLQSDVEGLGAEVIDFFLIGIVVGILADREREQKQALRQATRELSSVYRELQENFERMKRAERLYALGELSAGLAHEIRNPLASLGGAIGILRRNPSSEQKRSECLEIMSKECHRLNVLVSNFLDFAKPRLPRFQTVDVGAILDSVIELVSHAIDHKPITLSKKMPRDFPTLETDAEQLRQVLLNLVINAIQASPEGGDIVLSAHIRDGQVLIQVKDQGCGISAENLEKVFDPFFTTKENGTGLGLSVAHQIVGQLGGVLAAERNPDRGMTFSLQLPCNSRRVL